MPRPSRRIPMEVDSDSDDDDQPSVSQVSRNMRRINVSQSGKRGKTKGKQVDSDSDEEPQTSRNTQRMNGSQRGRKANARQMDSDSDEEPQPSTSQASQKRRRNNAAQSRKTHQATMNGVGDTLIGEEISASQISPNTSLTEQEENHHVANVVKYILAADHTNVPIDRSKISKDIDCHNKHFRGIFKSAQEILKDVFGYLIVEMEDENKNDGKNQGKQGKSQKFILVNTIDKQDLFDDIDEDTSTQYVLLFLCLSHIFMSGDKCTKDSLETFLKKLEIIPEQQHVMHETFGDAMTVVMNNFVKEKYINVQGPEKELTWGVRAIKELKPRAVMEFLSQMYDGRSLNSWPQEYDLLLKKEREMNQRPNGQMNGEHH